MEVMRAEAHFHCHRLLIRKKHPAGPECVRDQSVCLQAMLVRDGQIPESNALRHFAPEHSGSDLDEMTRLGPSHRVLVQLRHVY